jgi:hypothetical protein
MTVSPSWNPLASRFEIPLHHKLQCIILKLLENHGTSPDADFHLAIEGGHPNLPLMQLRHAPSLPAHKT